MNKSLTVILLQDVVHLGHKHDVKSVSMGFAKNWLIPNNLVSVATPAMIALAATHQTSVENKKKEEAAKYEKILAALEGFTLRLRPKKNKQGTLYEGIDANAIVEKLKEKKIVLDPKFITLDEPIKQIGEYDVPVVLSKDSKTTIKIIVQ